MNRELASTVIAILVILGFFVVVIVVLIGFVNIENPETAKLVGMLVGWFTGLLSPMIMSYFKDHTPPSGGTP